MYCSWILACFMNDCGGSFEENLNGCLALGDYIFNQVNKKTINSSQLRFNTEILKLSFALIDSGPISASSTFPSLVVIPRYTIHSMQIILSPRVSFILFQNRSLAPSCWAMLCYLVKSGSWIRALFCWKSNTSAMKSSIDIKKPANALNSRHTESSLNFCLNMTHLR